LARIVLSGLLRTGLAIFPPALRRWSAFRSTFFRKRATPAGR
jgi:hypothetical protein